jgi:predicted dehydrogenase/NADPH:quinone reductase-like Zn-dependent oxidoreductase
MRQIVQNIKSGETALEQIPTPHVGEGKVLIKTHRSQVSLGTERMLVKFGQSNMLEKARQQPERVKEVLNKMKTDGIKPTVDAVFRKLDTPLPLGYSNAGEVIETGPGVTEFQRGDRVVSNGPHAEVVSVPRNLAAKIPDGVSYEEAVFTIIGAIALEGMRLLKPDFGETVAVMGLGLVGLMAVQLLQANGCNVIGIDPDESKLKIARGFGIKTVQTGVDDPVKFVQHETAQIGADGVLIAASTKADTVAKQSAQMSRKRGRIVLVGIVGLDLDRSDFYEKELSFQVSCSYGPGRYDDEYEQKGQDYPLPFVRWTEKRNFEAVLQAIERGAINVQPLITKSLPLDDYQQIYKAIAGSDSIASLLEYSVDGSEDGSYTQPVITLSNNGIVPGKADIAVIGAGNFTQAVLLPALKEAEAPLKYIVSSGGLSSTQLAEKYAIEKSATDYKAVLSDDSLKGVLVTTRHNLHAPMVIDALHAGKEVFVEKPLALAQHELDAVIEAKESSGKSVMVGFNRRFSPHTQKMKKLLGAQPGPMNVIATMNAGRLPPDSWLQDPEAGGGRIIGEACHHIDLITCLTGSQVKSIFMQAMGSDPQENTDNASIILKYENGSLGVVNYFANGSKMYAKERVEVYYQGKNLILDNFRRLYGYGYGQLLSNRMLRTKQDKGHSEQFKRIIKNWERGGETLIPFREIVNSSRAALLAVESLKKGEEIDIQP